jgi:RimJ/RimL family protein N-acetyltransferase
MSSYWTGEKVVLRGTEPDDWQAFQRFDQFSADQRLLERLEPPRSVASYRALFEERATRPPNGDAFTLTVCSRENDEVVGAVTTHNCDLTAGRFLFGIRIGREYQRRGFASEAVILVLGFMFGERRYQKCDSFAYSINTASIELHRKLGFVQEGVRRRNAFLAGDYCDTVLFGMTAEEFGARHPFPQT